MAMNVLSLCRICLLDSNDLHNLFELYFEDSPDPIASRIEKISGVEIKPSSNHPISICKSCTEDLSAALRFRCNIIRSTELLKARSVNNQSQHLGVVKEEYLDTGIEYSDDVEVLELAELNQNTKQQKQNIDAVAEQLSIRVEEKEAQQPYDEVLVVNKEEQVTEDDYETTDAGDQAELVEEESEVLVEEHLNDDVGGNDYSDQVDVQTPNEEPRHRKRKNKGVFGQTKQRIICEVCGSVYNNKAALWTHQKRHEGVKKYKCELCTMEFFDKSVLKGHMLTHTKEKRFSCSTCGRKFGTLCSTKRHERIHSGERPYVCTFKDCSKSFTLSHGLARHILIHTGQKPYECKDCGDKFTQSQHLKAHQNIHLRESGKPYTKYKRPTRKRKPSVVVEVETPRDNG